VIDRFFFQAYFWKCPPPAVLALTVAELQVWERANQRVVEEIKRETHAP
jgi:hypothetical protein